MLDVGFEESSTGPVPEELCLPVDVHGVALETHPSGWTVFEGCEPGTVLLQPPGAPALATFDTVEPLYDQYGPSLLGLPGALDFTMTPCCLSEVEVCLGVAALEEDFEYGEALAYLNELFAGLDMGCVGVVVLFTG